MSVGEIKPSEDRPSLLAPSVIDSPNDVRSNDPAESDTRRHAVVFETDVFEAVKHLPGIQERRNFEIGCDAGNFCSCHMNAFLDTGRDQVLVDESIDPVTSEIVLSPQRTLLKKRHFPSQCGLQVGPYHEDGALGFAGEKLLHFQLIV